MHSENAGDSSKLRFDFVFNDDSALFTCIGVAMRQLPQWRNSYHIKPAASKAKQVAMRLISLNITDFQFPESSMGFLPKWQYIG